MKRENLVQTGGAHPGDPGARRPSAVGESAPPRPRDESALGHRRWVIPGGLMPVRSTGPEPGFTSHEKLSLMNTGTDLAHVRITVYFEDAEPVGPFRLTLGPRRTRQVRFNDLIFPVALPLGVSYSALVESDLPIIVQFTRMDTRRRELALLGTIAWWDEESSG